MNWVTALRTNAVKPMESDLQYKLIKGLENIVRYKNASYVMGLFHHVFLIIN